MNQYHEWTDEQINREIAGRLGWYVRNRDYNYILVAPHEKAYTEEQYDLLFRHGQWYESEEVCWRVGLERNSDWANDLNMSIQLADKAPTDFILQSKAKEIWFCWFRGLNHSDAQAVADTPARAICEAWLLWKDAQS